MKEIKEEITKTEYITKYQAIDGELFDDKQECCMYEDSLKAITQHKYNKLILKKGIDEYDVFGLGSEENPVEVVKVESKEDSDLIKQLYMMVNSYYQDKEMPRWMKDDLDEIDNAEKNKDILFVGRGYEYNGFWIYGSTKSLCAKINEFKKLLKSKPEPEYGGC